MKGLIVCEEEEKGFLWKNIKKEKRKRVEENCDGEEKDEEETNEREEENRRWIN
jgi:hypothetical protein